MKDVQMTFRIEPELRASFIQAAENDQRPAAQVLRELMRVYVEQSRQKAPISAAERQRREEAVNFARASMGLEGFIRSDKAEAHAQRFVSGEIDLDEYLAPSYQEIHGSRQ